MRRFHPGYACTSWAAVIVVCVGLVGCMPTQTVQQGKDLCGAGIQYADALDKLLTVTIDTVIDYDSDELLQQRQYGDPNRFAQFLDERDEVLIPQVKALEALRSDGLRLKAYFVNLQALVDANLQDSAAAAVEDLSGSIAAANADLRKSNRIDLDAKEQADLGRLAGLVTKSVHAGAVRAALERDAAVIGEQLTLHEKLLAKLKGILEDRYQNQLDAVKNERIRDPYVNAAQPIPAQWKQDRRQWIKSGFYLEELTRATEAIRQVRFIWAGILQGEWDAASLQLALDDIHECTQAAQALHETHKEKEKRDE